MKRAFFLAALMVASCTQVNNNTFTSVPTGASGVGGGQVVEPGVVDRILINGPNRFQNGTEETYIVSMFEAGGNQVVAPYRAFIDGPSIIEILSPQGISLDPNILVKGRLLGPDNETELVVQSGDTQGKITIRISPASP